MRMTKEKERERADANISDLSDILTAKWFDHAGPVVPVSPPAGPEIPRSFTRLWRRYPNIVRSMPGA